MIIPGSRVNCERCQAADWMASSGWVSLETMTMEAGTVTDVTMDGGEPQLWQTQCITVSYSVRKDRIAGHQIISKIKVSLLLGRDFST